VVGGGGAPEEHQYQPGDPRLEPDRSSRILGLGKQRPEGRRAVLTAVISTVVFFSVITWVVVHSPNWPAVKNQFFNGAEFKDAFPGILRAFWVNVKMFMTAEVFILAFALLLAVMRSLTGPIFFPIRLLSVAYVDLFRGIPTILVIYILGFGVPGLQLPGVPNSPYFWGVVSLILVYSAYVAEVYRAGIESVHGSQVAAARSLGLSRWMSMRHVVLPQAIRRVIPPLLNDFIGLQKDTALVASLGVVEAFRQAQIDSANTFNYTPYLATALIFVVITIPLARFTDYLVARGRKRRAAEGVR
jgi:polar amino acid transport system permease protein